MKKTKFSFEIFPPKAGADIEKIYETIDSLSVFSPQFISVTYGAGGSVRNNKTVALSEYIVKSGKTEGLAHLTCCSTDREEVDEILKELKRAKVNSVLALRGDKNPNSKESKDFLYASDLVYYIKSKSNLKVYGACYPEGHLEAKSLDDDINNLKKKVDSGTDELISQLFFDNGIYLKYLETLKKNSIDIPVHAGIMPVVSTKSLLKMTLMCGATVPRELMKILYKYQFSEEEVKKAGLEYSINQINNLIENGVENIHIYTMNNKEVAKTLLGGVING